MCIYTLYAHVRAHAHTYTRFRTCMLKCAIALLSDDATTQLTMSEPWYGIQKCAIALPSEDATTQLTMSEP